MWTEMSLRPVEMAQVGMQDLRDFQAALPMRGALLTSDGDRGGGGGADGVAGGVANGGMPAA